VAIPAHRCQHVEFMKVCTERMMQRTKTTSRTGFRKRQVMRVKTRSLSGVLLAAS